MKIISNKNTKKHLNIFEFFSGIGGMHQALKNISSPNIEISNIFPFDINPQANLTYLHNFGIKPNEISIENISLKNYTDFCQIFLKEKNGSMLWIMSPPCQPFTRLGNKKDLDDPGCIAFKRILSLLEGMQPEHLPNHILLENESNACEQLLSILKIKEYNVKEFLLSPNQIGVPNSRLRYYLLAKLEKDSVEKFKFSILEKDKIIKSPDVLLKKNLLIEGEQRAPNLKTFLNYNIEEEILFSKKDFHVPRSILLKDSALVVDLVTINSNITNCFTKGYGRFLKGSGSLLLLDDSILQRKFKLPDLDGSIRFFSPEEICKLMSFNEHFSFPSKISVKSKYKLLGNSVNVKVVTLLLKYLLFNF